MLGMRDKKKPPPRESLFNSTFECVHRVGLDNLSVSEIVKGAGVSRPTFYSMFGQVDDLLAEIWIDKGNAWVLQMCDPSIEPPFRDSPSRTLLEIFLVAPRKPAVLEVLQPSLSRLVEERFPDQREKTVALWTFANRLGDFATRDLWPAAAKAAILDSYLQAVQGKEFNTARVETEQLASVDNLPGTQPDEELLLAALNIIQNSGVSGLTVSRLARFLGSTSTFVYPRIESVEKLAAQAYDFALTQVTSTNMSRWNKKRLGVEGYAGYIVGGLDDSRINWRRFRAEALIAAPHFPILKDGVATSMDGFAERALTRNSRLPIPRELSWNFVALTHTLSFGFAALHATGLPVQSLAHNGIIQAILLEVGKRVLRGSALS